MAEPQPNGNQNQEQGELHEWGGSGGNPWREWGIQNQAQAACKGSRDLEKVICKNCVCGCCLIMFRSCARPGLRGREKAGQVMVVHRGRLGGGFWGRGNQPQSPGEDRSTNPKCLPVYKGQN